MAKRTFEQWIDGIFNHPVLERQWYWDTDDHCVEDDQTNVEYLTKLFAHAERLLRSFDDAQVEQGLWMIASITCSEHSSSIIYGEAAWPARRTAIRAINTLYADFFAKRCTQTLSHRNERGNALNGICYMWWDIFPAGNGPYPIENFGREAYDEYIDVTERCLSIPHDACIEGALHGLGHFQDESNGLVEAIIDRFLQTRTDLRPELVQYALRARDGGVQ